MKRLAMLFLMCGTFLAMGADELDVTVGWNYSKGGRARLRTTSLTEHDVAGDAVIDNLQNVATNATGTALLLGGVTEAGFGWFQNTDASNQVSIGTMDANTNFVAFVRLRPAESAALWLATTNVYAVAYTNAVDLDYSIFSR